MHFYLQMSIFPNILKNLLSEGVYLRNDITYSPSGTQNQI